MSTPEPRGEFVPNQQSWLDQGAIREDAAWEAEQIRDFSRQVYRVGERFRVAESGELERVQPYAAEWMGEIQQRFESADFRLVGDFEDVVLNGTRPRTLKRLIQRAFLDRRDGATMATLSVARLAGLANLAWMLRLMPRTALLIDLETELSDGRFVATSNMLGLDTSDPFPGVIRRQVPPTTSVPEMLAEHRRVLAEALAQAPGVSLRPARSLAEAIGLQQRLADLKARHRESVGHLTPSEVRRNAGGRADRSVQLLMEAAEERPATPPPKPPSVLWGLVVSFAVLVAVIALLPVLLPLRIVRGLWWRLRGRPTVNADLYQYDGEGEADDSDEDGDGDGDGDDDDDDRQTQPSAS